MPESFSPLDGSGSGVAITHPGGIAIDEASGNVFVNDGDGFSTPQVTDILGAEGGAPAGLVSPFQLTGFCFPAPQNGIAVDNSPTSPNQGTLYVIDCGGKIKKFTRDQLSEEYKAAGELTATVTFESAAGAALDAHGNLFVADAFGGSGFSGAVVKFSPDGTQVAHFDLASSLNFASDVAVNSAGDLFVSGGGRAYKYPADASGEIDPSVFTEILSEGATGLAVDLATNNLFIALSDRVAQYDATTLDKEFEFGAGSLGQTFRLAVNSAADRIYASDSSKDSIAVFGPPVPIPDVTTNAASEVSGTTASLNGIVNPEGVVVIDCVFEYGLTTAYGSTVPCEGAVPTDSSDHAVTAAVSSLEPNGATYHFRLVVDSTNGSVQGTDRTLVTDSTVSTDPATAIADTEATLNGIVRPEGEPLTGCVFEYGTALDYGQSIPCTPPFSAIPDDFDDHAVSATPTNLVPNSIYHFRLATTNADGTVRGEDRIFTTLGPPQIVEQRPLDADQASVVLQARINPSGSPTTYHFEFGADTSYGIRIPSDHELVAGSGTQPVAVSALRGGLQEKSIYYFRVVASNSSGTTVGPNQRLETLNEHGLPNRRAFELVTPADKGSSGSVASDSSLQQETQASVDGESFMYPLTNGTNISTAGGWLRQRAVRTDSGWLSTQISAPALVPPPGSGEFQKPSMLRFASPDIDCGFLESYNPLTGDTPQTGVELGVTNLYRWNADGDYELVTNRFPLNPEIKLGDTSGFYEKVDASDDCSRVYFTSRYELIPGASDLYEWDEGTLRDAGVLPNDEAGAGAVLGGETNSGGTARWNAVSPDGSRLFFTAIANEGLSSGRPAVFMRENDPSCEPLPAPCTVEISASETAVPSNGARFEAASPDGSRVFFRANYGISDTSSAEPTTGACGPLSGETDFDNNPKIEKTPCDLYAYDVESGELTDLSVDTTAADASVGAQIQGAVAVDEDGSHVYFAALGQLVPGKGRTYAENTAGFGSANVYLAHDDLDDDEFSYELSYVTTLAEHGPAPGGGGNRTGDLIGFDRFFGAALMRRPEAWVAGTSADGGELLFMSSRNLTGWESGGIDKYAAYLYSAESGQLACVSCRPDGLPSIASSAGGGSFAQSSFLLASAQAWGYRPRSITNDGSRVFFTSPDVLAPGAVAGKRNVYEWQEGQVFFLAVAEGAGLNGLSSFRGASASGDDVFIATGERLAPQDIDFLSDIYDVRVDGGFPFLSEPPDCQVDESVPLLPNQTYCQGNPAPQPQAPGPASPNITGPGNPLRADPRPKPCRKGKVRRRGKCVKPPKRGPKRERNRAAKTNRGGAK